MRALAFALLLVSTTAAADIRFPDDDDKPKPQVPEITPVPRDPIPVAETPEIRKGCAAREGQGAEWLFGLGVLGIGLAGMRKLSPRRAVT